MRINSVKYILSQVLIWGVGWLFMLFILSNGGTLDARFWNRAILTAIGASIVVFVNLKWLLPNLYFKKKRVAYFFSTAVLLIVVVWGVHSDLLPWNQTEFEGFKKEAYSQERERNDSQEVLGNYRWLLRNLPPLFISLLGSSMASFSRFANEKEKAIIHLERAKLETEIKFLKSQINPHFLFNALHNIYALTIIQSDQSSEQLLKLSDILRYMLYDSDKAQVFLKRELEYLNNYLDLVQLKDSRGMDIRFDVEVDDAYIKIAPLLFIPFVENAFKHGQIEDLDKGYIRINLKAKANKLIFKIENSKPQIEINKDKTGGIGLKNIQERLKLLYPQKYMLQIQETASAFSVLLELNYS